jgi:hypothetical protein
MVQLERPASSVVMATIEPWQDFSILDIDRKKPHYSPQRSQKDPCLPTCDQAFCYHPQSVPCRCDTGFFTHRTEMNLHEPGRLPSTVRAYQHIGVASAAAPPREV